MEKCPHCGMVLIEKIYNKIRSKNHDDLKNNTQHTKRQFSLKNLYRKVLNKLKSIKLYKHNFDNYKKAFIFISVIIFVIGLLSNNKTKIIDIPTPIYQPVNTRINDTINNNDKIPQKYISLDNGTILSRNSFVLDGYGILKISNGTNHDAIAKLINSNSNKSIIVVYIKAKSVYTIKDIADGNYKLAFNLGNNWDEVNKKFISNNSYDIFEDSFYYKTTVYQDSQYEHTRYTTFEVTLNPVIDGEAKTNEIDPNTFNNF